MDSPIWSATLIERGGKHIAPKITGGTYHWDISRKVVSGGSISTTTPPGNVVGMRLTLNARFRGKNHPQGQFCITACRPYFRGTPKASWELEFMDDASILDRQTLNVPVSLAKTVSAIGRARQVLAQVGVNAAIADSDRTLRVGMTWDADETRLDEVNRLLAVAGYHALWPSPSGLVAGPALNPSTLVEAHWFREGSESLHLPDYPQEQDLLAVPNRLRGTTKGDRDTLPLTSYVRDTATSQWSFEARGYWVDAETFTSDAPTQAALNAETNRKLRSLQMNAITMTIQHMWTPDLYPGCVVGVVADEPAVSGRWQVLRSEVPLVGTGLAFSELRKEVKVPNVYV